MIYLNRLKIRDGLSTGSRMILERHQSRAQCHGRMMQMSSDVPTVSKILLNIPSAGTIAEHVERLSVETRPLAVRLSQASTSPPVRFSAIFLFFQDTDVDTTANTHLSVTEKPPPNDTIALDIRLCKECNQAIFSYRDFQASLTSPSIESFTRSYTNLLLFTNSMGMQVKMWDVETPPDKPYLFLYYI